jgi:hypothetical protein
MQQYPTGAQQQPMQQQSPQQGLTKGKSMLYGLIGFMVMVFLIFLVSFIIFLSKYVINK